jgi:hypothetical protein
MPDAITIGASVAMRLVASDVIATMTYGVAVIDTGSDET